MVKTTVKNENKFFNRLNKNENFINDLKNSIIKKEIDIHNIKDGYNGLFYVRTINNLNILLEFGININDNNNSREETVLHYLIRKEKRMNIINHILNKCEKNINLKINDIYNCKILDYALMNDNFELIIKLYKMGAKLGKYECTDSNIFIYSIKNNNHKLLNYCIINNIAIDKYLKTSNSTSIYNNNFSHNHKINLELFKYYINNEKKTRVINNIVRYLYKNDSIIILKYFLKNDKYFLKQIINEKIIDSLIDSNSIKCAEHLYNNYNVMPLKHWNIIFW